MNIEIKEPCHENWQAMTTNQQGAFCKVCHKDVVDFSKKSINQIKSFFADKTNEKICGRFEKKQLTYLAFDDFFASFKYWVLSKKFAVIFFFTFGFISLTASAQANKRITGKIAAPQTDTVVETPKSHLTGDVAYLPGDSTKKKQTTIKGNTKCTTPPKKQKAKQSNIPVMGMIASPKKEAPKTK